MNKQERALAQLALLAMKGLLSECPQKDRDEVEDAAQDIRDTIAQYGDNGKVGFSLVLAEMQANGVFEEMGKSGGLDK